MGSLKKPLQAIAMKLLLLTILISATQAGNIAEELTAAGATTLVDFVVKAGLAETLSGPGPFTVFAPDNDAFAKLPADLVATLTGDVELLKKVLLFHVASGNVMSKDISNDITVDSVEGSPLRANVYLKSKYYDGFVTINGKRVYKADIVADNGVIHMVTDVIYPFPSGNIAEVVTGDERFSTLLAAVGAAGLADTLATGGPFTVFAPTNDAFAKVPRLLLMVFLQTKKPLLQSSSVMSYLEPFSPKESHGELTQLLGVTPLPPRCSRPGSLRLCPMRTTRGQLQEWWTPTSLQQMELFMLLILLYNSF